eukprot:Skav208233  [mRNA]  locus=scaffold2601:158766:159464:+ [translate_table: standard]
MFHERVAHEGDQGLEKHVCSVVEEVEIEKARLASQGCDQSIVQLQDATAESVARCDELSKFQIMPEKIRSGEDLRTAVMLRKIPKGCSDEAISELLAVCGLATSYTSTYVPSLKGRNRGFAFVNFRSPADVLALFECMTPPFWHSLKTIHHTMAKMPSVSYARLQDGRASKELSMKEFSPPRDQKMGRLSNSSTRPSESDFVQSHSQPLYQGRQGQRWQARQRYRAPGLSWN